MHHQTLGKGSVYIITQHKLLHKHILAQTRLCLLARECVHVHACLLNWDCHPGKGFPFQSHCHLHLSTGWSRSLCEIAAQGNSFQREFKLWIHSPSFFQRLIWANRDHLPSSWWQSRGPYLFSCALIPEKERAETLYLFSVPQTTPEGWLPWRNSAPARKIGPLNRHFP